MIKARRPRLLSQPQPVRQASAAVEALKRMRGIRGDSHIMQNAAAEIKIRAEWRLGHMLQEMEKQGPGQYKQIPNGFIMNPFEQSDVPPSYAELGIEKNAALRWQAIGARFGLLRGMG